MPLFDVEISTVIHVTFDVYQNMSYKISYFVAVANPPPKAKDDSSLDRNGQLSRESY